MKGMGFIGGEAVHDLVLLLLSLQVWLLAEEGRLYGLYSTTAPISISLSWWPLGKFKHFVVASRCCCDLLYTHVSFFT